MRGLTIVVTVMGTAQIHMVTAQIHKGGNVNPGNSIPFNELLGFSWPPIQFMPMHAHEWFVSSRSGENFGSPIISRAPKIMPKVAKFNQVS